MSEGVFVFPGPLHLTGPLCHTGCIHCASCGLGPQSYLTYRYETDEANGYNISHLSNGLCPSCAARA
jgi:hypothetical protein